MKTKICLLGIFALVTLAIAAPRAWVLKTGETVTGDYVSSGTTTLVVKTGGTNCFLAISDLSTNDQTYVAQMQFAQWQARLGAEAKQMAQAGWLELTEQMFDSFPEKVDDHNCWMDCEFDELEGEWVDASIELGFFVRDKNSDLFQFCFAPKVFVPVIPPATEPPPNPLIPEITKLKYGDKVRLIGKVVPYTFYSNHRLFEVQKVEMIETAAEKKAREQAAENP